MFHCSYNDVLVFHCSKVHHPNICSFLGILSVDEGLAVLSPLVAGINLHEHLLFGSNKKVSSAN